jgi:SAM-dependent methyltransferase
MERYNAYDAFAWFYNRHWAGQWVPRILPLMERLLLVDIPADAAILDLCCGTGHIADALTRRGYRVAGVDGSEEMLRFARQNAPQAAFHLADARSFTLDRPCDAAYSSYDSLNHLMSIADLGAAFACIARALKPGAPFLFDLNMDIGYRERWKGSFSFIESDHVVATKTAYDPDQKLGRMEFALFRLVEQSWQRTDLILEQRAYSADEVRATLAAAGFGPGRMFDHAGVEIMAESGRTFFLTNRAT